MLEQFHFLHPLWLLALLPFALLLWLVSRSRSDSKAWENIIDAKLLPLLLQGEDTKTGKLAKWLLAIGWFIGIIALANPVWEKIPRPIFQTNSARIIVLDLSNSMLISDLKPSRLARARFKIEDILSRQEEVQTGLVLFAGDAFTASPLTRDSETIRSLLTILTPQLMPTQGSRADLGLVRAQELLEQAGVNNGQVLLIADGVSNNSKAIDAANALRKQGHSVSVLGVGTKFGGELKFRNGSSITVKLESNNLRNIAHNGDGKYHLISTDNADLQRLLTLNIAKLNNNSQLEKQDIKSEQWKSSGPFLILLLLPLAALVFRRGWLLNIIISIGLLGVLTQPQNAIAAPLSEKTGNLWEKLWNNKEQQANNAFQKQQYDKASKLTKDTFRRGSAEYKKGDYQKALKDFQKTNGADARYNEGNTLAKLGKYKEAIDTYSKALKEQPDMQDAKENKATVEELLKKQHKNDKEQNQDNQKKDNKSSKDKKKNDQPEKQQDKKKQQEQSQDNNEQSKDEQNKSDTNSNKEQKGSDKKESEQKKDSDDQSGNQQGDKKQQKASKKDQDKDNKNQFSDAAKELEKKNNQEKNKVKNTNKETSDKKPKDVKKNKESAQQEENDQLQKPEGDLQTKGTKEQSKELTKEEKMAAEQWLRRIPDDPGGLLRRKFRSQHNQRRRRLGTTGNPW